MYPGKDYSSLHSLFLYFSQFIIFFQLRQARSIPEKAFRIMFLYQFQFYDTLDQRNEEVNQSDAFGRRFS